MRCTKLIGLVTIGIVTLTGCTVTEEVGQLSNQMVTAQGVSKKEDIAGYCNYCGKETYNITKFCSSCGKEAEWLVQPPTMLTMQQETPPVPQGKMIDYEEEPAIDEIECINCYEAVPAEGDYEFDYYEESTQSLEDTFTELFTNYFTTYIEALECGDPYIAARSQYVSVDGEVFQESMAYMNKNYQKLHENLIQVSITDMERIDNDTYDVTTYEVIDIVWTRDYSAEVAGNNSTESTQARNILLRTYRETDLYNRDVKIYKTNTIEEHYKVERGANGNWQITDYTDECKILDTVVHDAYLA